MQPSEEAGKKNKARTAGDSVSVRFKEVVPRVVPRVVPGVAHSLAVARFMFI